MDTNRYTLGLDELLERDMTSYELFHSLPHATQERVRMRDFGSYEELTGYLRTIRRGGK